MTNKHKYNGAKVDCNQAPTSLKHSNMVIYGNPGKPYISFFDWFSNNLYIKS